MNASIEQRNLDHWTRISFDGIFWEKKMTVPLEVNGYSFYS